MMPWMADVGTTSRPEGGAGHRVSLRNACVRVMDSAAAILMGNSVPNEPRPTRPRDLWAGPGRRVPVIAGGGSVLGRGCSAPCGGAVAVDAGLGFHGDAE